MLEVSMGRSLSSTQLLWPTCAIYCLSSCNLLVSLERSSAGRVQNMTIIFFRTSWTSFRTTLAGCEWILQGERAWMDTAGCELRSGVFYLLTSLSAVRRVPKGQREEETGHWSQGRDMEALTASVDPEDKHSSVLWIWLRANNQPKIIECQGYDQEVAYEALQICNLLYKRLLSRRRQRAANTMSKIWNRTSASSAFRCMWYPRSLAVSSERLCRRSKAWTAGILYSNRDTSIATGILYSNRYTL